MQLCLPFAAEAGDLACVSRFLGVSAGAATASAESKTSATLPSSDPDECLNDGSTGLILASNRGHLEVTRLLLEHKANPNKVNINGHTALSVAARWGGVPMCELLVKHGADHRIGNNPVYYSALQSTSKNRLDVCTWLLQHGCDPNRKVANVSPLFAATQEQLLPIVELLIARNADLTATNAPDGKTALQLARSLNATELASLLTPRLP